MWHLYLLICCSGFHVGGRLPGYFFFLFFFYVCHLYVGLRWDNPSNKRCIFPLNVGVIYSPAYNVLSIASYISFLQMAGWIASQTFSSPIDHKHLIPYFIKLNGIMIYLPRWKSFQERRARMVVIISCILVSELKIK